MGMMSSVLDFMSLKCYQETEFGREIKTEIIDAENVHLEKMAGAEGGNGNIKTDRTEGWAEDSDQENKNSTLVL